MCVQRLPLSVLHHQVYILWRVYRLVKLDNVAVVELAEDSDLADGLLLALGFFELGAVVLLNSDSLTSRPMDALLYDSVSATANLFAKVISVEIAAVWRREIFSIQEVRSRATEAIGAVIGGSTELVLLHRMALVLVMLIGSPVIEERKTSMLLMMLLKKLLVAESLPVLFEFSCERVLLLCGVIHILHSHQSTMRR